MKLTVLVLAGIALIFFAVASTGLHFGFVLKMVSMTWGCSPYWWAVLTQSEGLFCPSHHPTTGGLCHQLGLNHNHPFGA